MTDLLTALSKAKKEIKPLKLRGKGQVGKQKIKYLLLDDLIKEADRVLPQHDLVYYHSFRGDALETHIAHTKTGQSISGFLNLSPQSLAGINLYQSEGMEITYKKRYMLGSMLGILTEEDSNASVEPVDKAEAAVAHKPWLNRTDRSGEKVTAQWTNLMQAVASGAITEIGQVTEHYRLSKETKKEVEALINL